MVLLRELLARVRRRYHYRCPFDLDRMGLRAPTREPASGFLPRWSRRRCGVGHTPPFV